jgi:hypothetical protein
MEHDAMCITCAPEYLRTSVKQLFEGKYNHTCLFCFQSTGLKKYIFDDNEIITIRDFGLRNCSFHFFMMENLLIEYLYDFLLELNDGISISKTRFKNTIEYWDGIGRMLRIATVSGPPPHVLKAIYTLGGAWAKNC